jgi:hypothetical protein
MKALIKYDDYVRERDSLSKFEQAAYDGYEKTILTLASAFLAFSLSFLGLIRGKGVQPGAQASLIAVGLLKLSWISFAVSVVVMLCNFMVNALGLRASVKDLEDALEKKQANSAQKWTRAGFFLYFLAGLAFTVGIVVLIRFCVCNVQRL